MPYMARSGLRCSLSFLSRIAAKSVIYTAHILHILSYFDINYNKMIGWDMTYVFFPSNFITHCTVLQHFLSMAQEENCLQDSVYGQMSEMLQGG